MATAAPSFHSTKEITNYARLCRLLVDVSAHVLRETFEKRRLSNNFDITLLMVLLRNICNLVRPATGWDTLPPAADTTLEADIVRIKCYRNTVYGHASEASVDDPTFNQYWKDIQDALVRLGGADYQNAVDDLKKECMDPYFEEHYKELLIQWVVDEVSIKERLEGMEEQFGKAWLK